MRAQLATFRYAAAGHVYAYAFCHADGYTYAFCHADGYACAGSSANGYAYAVQRSCRASRG
ncbi:MAG: hypothetical protein OXF62_11655 [Caldilineaceae bacterium]|nr:hypothetical protein [Caldilineaceae bacterium]